MYSVHAILSSFPKCTCTYNIVDEHQKYIPQNIKTNTCISFDIMYHAVCDYNTHIQFFFYLKYILEKTLGKSFFTYRI